MLERSSSTILQSYIYNYCIAFCMRIYIYIYIYCRSMKMFMTNTKSIIVFAKCHKLDGKTVDGMEFNVIGIPPLCQIRGKNR